MNRARSNMLKEHQFRVSDDDAIYCVQSWKVKRAKVLGVTVDRSMTVTIRIYDPETRTLRKPVTVGGDYAKSGKILSNGTKAEGLQAAHRYCAYLQSYLQPSEG